MEMKSISSYIEEAREIVLLSYIDRLHDKMMDNPDDEDAYMEVTADLFKYLSDRTNAQLKSIMDQLGLKYSSDVDQNKARILWYVIGEK